MKVRKNLSLLLLLLAVLPAAGQVNDQRQLDSLAGFLRVASDDSSRVRLLYQIMTIHDSYKTEEGLKYEAQALALANSTHWKKGAAMLKTHIGRLHWRLGNFRKARQLHGEALAIYESLGDNADIAYITTFIGQDYADDGKYAEALQYFEKARQIHEARNDYESLGGMYLFFAFVYGSQGDYAAAAKQNFKALEAFEKCGDESGIAVATSNIGEAYEKIGNYSAALKFYKQADKVHQKVGDHINRASGYNAIAGIYRRLKNYSEALANHDTALQIAREIEDQFCIASSHWGIGKTLKLQGQYAEALANFEQAAAHFQKISNKMELASVFAELGICQIQLKNLKQARAAFEQAEAIAKNLDSKIPFADLYRGMEILDSAEGNWQGAYANHKLYVALHDSIFNQESARKIMLSQLQYDFDKRELEAKVEQERREIERRNLLAIAFGTALLFFAVVFFQLKIRRDRAAAEAKRLHDLSEAKSQFLTTVSHELRTPLTSILGFSKIIKKRLEEWVLPVADLSDAKNARAAEQVIENLGIVVRESERLTHLINEVLDLAKIESGQAVWQEERVEIGKIIEHAAAAASNIFENKNLDLRLDLAPDLPATMGDAARLQQVMVNLLSNAAKFTEQGGVTVSAKLAAAADTILIGVADTGVGIAAADREQIFEKFKQVSSDTLTDKPQGTGLGLPICKEIVEHHGGQIWVESEAGTGAVFWLTLPVR